MSAPLALPAAVAPNPPATSAPSAASTSVVIMAAGAGSRMRSGLPKPLHDICGRPMLLHVLDAVAGIGPRRVVVVIGVGAEAVMTAVRSLAPPRLPIDFVVQKVARGTGDAVMVAVSALWGDLDFDPGFDAGYDRDRDTDAGDEDDVLVLAGDTPLIRTSTLTALVDRHARSEAAATMMSARMTDPTGMGRVVRDRAGRVMRIVEQADADSQEKAIDEVATSTYLFRRSLLSPALRRLRPNNSQGEYYLTDVIGVLAGAGHNVETLPAPDPAEAFGVNDRCQLAQAEEVMRDRINSGWMGSGVTMIDPRTTYVDAGVRLAPDVVLGPGTILKGNTTVGPGSQIGPHVLLRDCAIGPACSMSFVSGQRAEVGAGVRLDPFTVLCPGEVRPGDPAGLWRPGVTSPGDPH
ncbi:MAG: NTP transferase domain-containing protein [Acidimicrobiales bacterium]